MIKPEQIPDEAIEAAARAFACKEDGDDFVWDAYIPYAEYAIAAAINAWPSMEIIEVYDDPEWEGQPDRTVIELPLPQEKNDD